MTNFCEILFLALAGKLNLNVVDRRECVQIPLYPEIAKCMKSTRVSHQVVGGRCKVKLPWC